MSKIPKLEYYFPELQNCIQDIEMLKDGRWDPDEDSCNATIENLEIIKNKNMYKVGQWYQYKKYPECFRKCSEERGDRIIYSEKISDGQHYYKNDWGNYPFEKEGYILVNISTIAKYLPENHPDLLKFNPIYELW